MIEDFEIIYYVLRILYPYINNNNIFTYLECILIATIVIAIKVVRKKITMDKDYMIILGCQINGDGSLTPLLKGRVGKSLLRVCTPKPKSCMLQPRPTTAK